jgi:hypothetical protein
MLAAFGATGLSGAGKFYPDDPLGRAPAPRDAGAVKERNTDALYDFLKQSFRPSAAESVPAKAVNTLGEVPDSEWFTNRHGMRRMSIEELKRGPGDSNPPQPPYVAIGAKTDGITPGFRMRDAKGSVYFVKPDPRGNPEMATAADVIGAKFFHAIGYNTPENYLFHLREDEITVSKDATVNGLGNKKRAMMKRDLDDIFERVPRRADGSMRMVASAQVQGDALGPFRYEKTRRDDPNDVFPHEDRRDLRGLHVFCAWLNHTDAKALNSMDVLVTENGRRFVRHYLIDFGAMLGSDSDMPKNARFGHEYIIPRMGDAWKRIFAFGLDARPWERADFGSLKEVGRMEAEVFDPEKWTTNYPNPAFIRRLTDDEFWAAKIVTAFRDEEIRAIVETGQYSNPAVVDYLTRMLIQRRDRIGRTYFAKVLPLDRFAVNAGTLEFKDLGAEHGYSASRRYEVAWARFNNETGDAAEIAGATTAALPPVARELKPGQYLMATLRAANDAREVRVYLTANGDGWKVVGVERSW